MSKKCTLLWRDAHLEVKMLKTLGVRTTFGSWDVEKVHAVVARSTFPSQNVQNTPLSDHFWRFRCRKKCALLWREAHFQVKMYKTHHCRTTFGGWDVEKVHAIAARSTFRSQNVKNTRGSDHFWRLICRKKCTLLWCEAHFEVKMLKTPGVRTTFGGSDVGKSARCCGAKHISKSKCTKHTIAGPLLEVQMSKKCTLLRREAHVEVKMYKTHHCPTILEVQMSLRVADARDCAPCQKWAKRGGFVAFSTTTTTTPHYTPIHHTQLHSITFNYTTLHFTTLHYTTPTLHYTKLHYLPLHYITLHYITLHYITLHSTTLHYTTLHYLPLHFTTLHYTTLHNTTTPTIQQLHSTTLHYTKSHSTTLNYTTLRYTRLHSTTLHYITLHDTTFHYTTLYITLHYTPLHYTTLHYTTLPSTTFHNTTTTTTLHYIPLH